VCRFVEITADRARAPLGDPWPVSEPWLVLEQLTTVKPRQFFHEEIWIPRWKDAPPQNEWLWVTGPVEQINDIYESRCNTHLGKAVTWTVLDLEVGAACEVVGELEQHHHSDGYLSFRGLSGPLAAMPVIWDAAGPRPETRRPVVLRGIVEAARPPFFRAVDQGLRIRTTSCEVLGETTPAGQLRST
jgi:hypothetical protein